MNNVRFNYTSATILAIIAAVIAVAVSFGLDLSQHNIDTILTLAGLLLGGIVVGGGFKSRGLLMRGLNEHGRAATVGGSGVGLHFTPATILALVGAAIAVAVSFGLDLSQENIDSVLKLVGILAAAITFGGGVKSAGLVESGVHPALAPTYQASAATGSASPPQRR